MLALLLASPSTALRPNTTLNPCLGHEATSKATAPFIEKVWRLIYWERGKPKLSTVRAFKFKLECAAGPGHVAALLHRWRSAKKAFRRHRARKLAEQRQVEALRSTLEAIAACESGGDPGAVSPDGSYRGKYQFDYRTWASVGGSGDPAAASESEQDYRAALLYQVRGSAPWPVCGFQ